MTERADPPASQVWLPSQRPWPGDHADPAESSEQAERAWALVGYLSAALLGFLPPLAIYLLRSRRSPSLRRHAAQAANAAITLLLYLICAAVVGGALAFGSVSAGLRTGALAALVLWVAAASYLTRAALAALNGTFFRIPDWLCATLLRPERQGRTRPSP
jgi:uncharacterized Tic20 family protein